MSAIIFTSDRREALFGGWSRTLKVGDQEYCVCVTRGRSVRIPYKPRGQNRGWKWNASVYRIGTNHGRVWSGSVEKSLGCRGILLEAGVLTELH